jgi:hypothetical protein
MGKKGVCSKRGQGEIYSEPKSQPVYVLVTPTAAAGIDMLAKLYGLSRSEFLEQIGRGTLKVFPGANFSRALRKAFVSAVESSKS